MTIKVRRIISLIFICLFLTITPAVMLYAAGYRLAKNGLSVQRTGMFIIDSQPTGAQIFLDGRPQQSWFSLILNKKNYLTTPAKIKNLLPGEYDIIIKLDDYRDWQKKLAVQPGAATFAEDIYLFKNDSPALVAPAEAEKISWSPDKTQVLIIYDDRLTFHDLGAAAQKTVSQKETKGRNVSWSQNGQRIIIDGWLYDLNDLNSKINLNQLAAGATNFKWSGDVLYFQDKNSIYRLATAKTAKKIIGPLYFNDYLVKNGYLYLLTEDGQSANLRIIDPSTLKTIKNSKLPGANDYAFINQGQAWLNLYSPGQKTLYLINPADTAASPTAITTEAQTAFWTGDGDLLYADDFEVWLYHPSSKTKTLITRISQAIGGAVMHPSKNYIIYFTAKTVNAIELDERGGRNVSELAKFDSINSLALNSAGDTLYLAGRLGDQPGLYKLLIQ